MGKNEGDEVKNNQNENWDFKFDGIMHDSSQEALYDECGQPLVKNLLLGQNGTLVLIEVQSWHMDKRDLANPLR